MAKQTVKGPKQWSTSMPADLHTAWKSAAGADRVTMRHQLIKWVERYLAVRSDNGKRLRALAKKTLRSDSG